MLFASHGSFRGLLCHGNCTPKNLLGRQPKEGDERRERSAIQCIIHPQKTSETWGLRKAHKMIRFGCLPHGPSPMLTPKGNPEIAERKAEKEQKQAVSASRSNHVPFSSWDSKDKPMYSTVDMKLMLSSRLDVK